MTVGLVIPYRPVDRFRGASYPFVRAYLEASLPLHEVVIADDPDPSSFNRGRALDAGIAQTDVDLLVLADADLWVPKMALLRAIELAAQGALVTPFSRITFLNRQATSDVIRRNHYALEKNWRGDEVAQFWNKRSDGGCSVLLRDNYVKAGGFDRTFDRWGFEDAAFSSAYSTLIGKREWVEAPAVHLWHPTCRNTRDPLFRKRWDYCREYERAFGNPEAMAELIGRRAN